MLLRIGLKVFLKPGVWFFVPVFGVADFVKNKLNWSGNDY